METKPIDKLPFNPIAADNFKVCFSLEHEKEREIKTHKDKIEKMGLFNNCCICGLGLHCGFLVRMPDGIEVGYLVTQINFLEYEITGTRFDLGEPNSRTIRVVHSIQNSKIKGIIGHLGSIII